MLMVGVAAHWYEKEEDYKGWEEKGNLYILDTCMKL